MTHFGFRTSQMFLKCVAGSCDAPQVMMEFITSTHVGSEPERRTQPTFDGASYADRPESLYGFREHLVGADWVQPSCPSSSHSSSGVFVGHRLLPSHRHDNSGDSCFGRGQWTGFRRGKRNPMHNWPRRGERSYQVEFLERVLLCELESMNMVLDVVVPLVALSSLHSVRSPNVNCVIVLPRIVLIAAYVGPKWSACSQ